MMTMDYSSHIHADAGDATQSRTLSNHTESVTRVNQARAHLAHKLRDKSAHSTNHVMWEYPPESRETISNRWVPRSGYPRARRNVVSASVQNRKDLQDRTHAVTQSAADWSQNMTLTQVHRLLKSRGSHMTGLTPNAQPNSQLPDIRIRIAPVPETYPSIKVTLGNKDTPESLAVFGNKMNQDKAGGDAARVDRSKSAGVKRNKPLVSQMLPRMVTTATTSRRQLTDTQILCNLDRAQMKCSEKIKMWMADNPLGAESNTDYDHRGEAPTPATQRLKTPPKLDLSKRFLECQQGLDPEQGQTTKTQQEMFCDALEATSCGSNNHDNHHKTEHVQINQTFNGHLYDKGSKLNKKSVRFGSHDWVIKDSNYLFD